MIGNFINRTSPGAEPISLTEAKKHCVVEISDDDALISGLIAAARAHVESATHLLMMTRSVRGSWPCFPGQFQLQAQLRKVASVQYLDAAAATQTLDAGNYAIDESELPGMIHLAYGESWPATYSHPKAVTVNFTAGYATPFTADATANTLTAVGHPCANGDIIQIYNSGGGLPAGLSASTDYHVVGISGNNLQLSATEGGAAIDIGGAGTGTHYLGVVPTEIRQAMLLLINHWYENRSAVNIGNITSTVPMGVDMLLAPLKVWGF